MGTGGELIVRLGRRWARILPWKILVTDRGEVMPRELGGSVIRGSGEGSLVQRVVRGRLGTTEGYFFVESAESLHFCLRLGETCLHLHVRLLELHDMIGSYKKGVKIVATRTDLKYRPRSKRETLLLF